MLGKYQNHLTFNADHKQMFWFTIQVVDAITIMWSCKAERCNDNSFDWMYSGDLEIKQLRRKFTCFPIMYGWLGWALSSVSDIFLILMLQTFKQSQMIYMTKSHMKYLDQKRSQLVIWVTLLLLLFNSHSSLRTHSFWPPVWLA